MLTIREAIIIALFAVFFALNTKADPEPVNLELAQLRVMNRHYAALIAACLNGRSWYHGDQMVFCDRQYSGIGR